MYNYCTEDPYSFMTIDTRPTATIPFKKNRYVKIFINNDS